MIQSYIHFLDDISIGNVADDDNIINPGLGLKTPNPRSKPTASVWSLLVSEPDVIRIPDPDQSIQQQQQQQQATEVVTISDEDEDDSSISILKGSHSSLHHLSGVLSKWKRSNFWGKIKGI